MKTVKTNFYRLNRSPFSRWFWLLITLIVISIFTTSSPMEQSFGKHVRIVYLHGAWVWASLVTSNVLHPASPIMNSDAWRIQLFFMGLVLLTLIASWQIARWWYSRE